MKTLILTLMLISSASLWAQSSGAAGVTIAVRLHSIFAMDDLVVECVQSGEQGLVTLSLKTLSTDLMDVHLTLPEKIRNEEYYVEKMRLLAGEPFKLFQVKRGVLEHTARISVLHADFNLCENMGDLILASTPR